MRGRHIHVWEGKWTFDWCHQTCKCGAERTIWDDFWIGDVLYGVREGDKEAKELLDARDSARRRFLTSSPSDA